jgi:hypothetical protein
MRGYRPMVGTSAEAFCLHMRRVNYGGLEMVHGLKISSVGSLLRRAHLPTSTASRLEQRSGTVGVRTIIAFRANKSPARSGRHCHLTDMNARPFTESEFSILSAHYSAAGQTRNFLLLKLGCGTATASRSSSPYESAVFGPAPT